MGRFGLRLVIKDLDGNKAENNLEQVKDLVGAFY